MSGLKEPTVSTAPRHYYPQDRITSMYGYLSMVILARAKKVKNV